ncbi:MAG: hypothetical protein NTV80_09885, partial [Verrucomicrobia bacterium]|nr:hypothetical protein [Verrucomicrobiota bacterium]
ISMVWEPHQTSEALLELTPQAACLQRLLRDQVIFRTCHFSIHDQQFTVPCSSLMVRSLLLVTF